jgi:uncharacterized membrane protein YfcA
LIALIVGGVCAAPLGGYVVKRISARMLMILVGTLIVALSIWQIARWLKVV